MNVFEAVSCDLKLRDKIGRDTYGGDLNPHDSSRDWLQSAYEEALDLCVYLKAELIKRGQTS